ncbi:MAG TPA: alkaline phosphatase family protein [Terriglobia bacterium]|nr:alkaline phosphatase family protein [Terriglobia bacterium]
MIHCRKWLPRVWILGAFFVCLGLSATALRAASKGQHSGHKGGKAAHIHTVFIILMENKNWSDVQGNNLAPYINKTLLRKGSYADQYYNPPGIHPSLPNYLWLEAGTNFGILNDNPPSTDHQSTSSHLATLLNNAGITWKAYAENITGTSCPLTDSYPYAVRHDPFVYFDDVTDTLNSNSAYCIDHIRPYTELAGDLANNTVAQYNFIIPNVCDDMHDNCGTDPVQAGDTWLSNAVPPILNSMAYQSGGALFITWDEGVGSDGPIGMIALSPLGKGHGYHNSIHYTHGSTLRSIEEIFGLTPFLGDAANETDLSDLFKSFP